MKWRSKISKYMWSMLLLMLLSYIYNILPSSGNLSNESTIIFSATTDKLKYEIGDSIGIIYTLQNPSDTTVVLWFANSCTFDYYIDEFHFLGVMGCLASPTSITIPPETTLVINGYHDNSYYLPGVGEHFFKGILIGYDTAYANFYITDPSNVSEINNSPKSFCLSQNYPNPFNPETIIKYSVLVDANRTTAFVQLKVYDIVGNEIATLVNEERPAGEYEVGFNVGASRRLALTSGVYFYQLKAGNSVETKKMILLK